MADPRRRSPGALWHGRLSSECIRSRRKPRRFRGARGRAATAGVPSQQCWSARNVELTRRMLKNAGELLAEEKRGRSPMCVSACASASVKQARALAQRQLLSRNLWFGDVHREHVNISWKTVRFSPMIVEQQHKQHGRLPFQALLPARAGFQRWLAAVSILRHPATLLQLQQHHNLVSPT